MRKIQGSQKMNSLAYHFEFKQFKSQIKKKKSKKRSKMLSPTGLLEQDFRPIKSIHKDEPPEEGDGV